MKNKGLLVALAVIGVIAIIVVVLFLGFFWGRGWFGGGCCGGWNNGNVHPWSGRGMMGGWNMGWSDGSGSWWGGRGMFKNGGNNGFGGMGGFRNGTSITGATTSGADVLSIEEAESAVEAYIEEYGAEEELTIREIMIFDNHAYAEVEEEETGIGAFEVLVDPASMAVFPEMGPNMMWNLKYSHMRGGMMGGGYNRSTEDMPISDEEALELANEYLSQNNSDMVAAGHPDRFYGYYTIHTERDGEIVGMLSVNGYDGEVFLHTWHGEFIEMSEHADDTHAE